MDFFKSSSAEGAGADNNCSADGVVGCTTTTDDNLDVVDEVDPLLIKNPLLIKRSFLDVVDEVDP